MTFRGHRKRFTTWKIKQIENIDFYRGFQVYPRSEKQDYLPPGKDLLSTYRLPSHLARVQLFVSCQYCFEELNIKGKYIQRQLTFFWSVSYCFQLPLNALLYPKITMGHSFYNFFAHCGGKNTHLVSLCLVLSPSTRSPVQVEPDSLIFQRKCIGWGTLLGFEGSVNLSVDLLFHSQNIF